MDKNTAYLLWFDELEREDVAIAGGKSSSLGEMTSKVEVPVPYGFATTACAYKYFFESTGLDLEIRELVSIKGNHGCVNLSYQYRNGTTHVIAQIYALTFS